MSPFHIDIQKQSMANDSSKTSESAMETTNPKRKRTTRSSTNSLPNNSSTSTEDSNNRDDDKPSRQQDIETIAKEETLYHIEMAWRAQQRLVRRCLGLRMFSEEKEEKKTQSSPTDD